MQETPWSLADRLRTEGGRVVDFFNQLTPEQWDKQLYEEEGGWSLRELLAHFVSAEIGKRRLVVSIVAGGEGAPNGFDIDAFNRSEVEKLKHLPTSRLLQMFSQERAKLIKFVTSLISEDLRKKGRDPYLGIVPLNEIIRLVYLHLQIHLRDARRCL